ncbi:C-type lectin domain-containing protein [Croceitalea marina]|uniref:C-type lectin domain-containing protein n=1 Tax=Croceitalea marina TaxID=1775166 RepID=A0ABW5MW88_9FLAO
MQTIQKILLILLILLWHTESYCQNTYADDFNTLAYSNNTGNSSFSSNWIESNETTSPTSGKIQITSNQLRFRNLDDVIITRDLDLTNAIAATLTFTYNRTNGDETLEVLLFDGTSYSVITTLNGSGSLSYSLNPNEISPNTSIRFQSGSGNWNGSEEILIDDILFNVQFPNNPPDIVGFGDDVMCPGDSKPIAKSISISDTDDTSTENVSVQISSGYVNGEDLLTLTGSHPNITASWDIVEGKLTLTGPALYTEFEAAILDVVYSSSGLNPSGTRQFSITVGEANFLPASQHYYEFVAAPGITWTVAETAAASRSYFGLQGYLATLTSQEEADFSGSQAAGFGWIGANDSAVEGEWRWVTGPEAGTQFWSGGVSGTELTYANWNGSEPNNCCGGENYAHIADPSVIRGGAPTGAWNDLPNTGGGGAYASQGYVVEYGGMPGDPVLNITLTTKIIFSCTIITNRRITYRVKRN